MRKTRPCGVQRQAARDGEALNDACHTKAERALHKTQTETETETARET